MTNADTAPEEAHNEGIEDGRMTGIVLGLLFIRSLACVPDEQLHA